jgi:type II secretory pathway pseudopilin PulG
METHLLVAPRRNNRRSAFSLVEMIGVLAIIAILAVVIVPKVFSTIASSRITNAVASVTSIKTAITDFAGKYGTVPTTNNNSRIDDLLFTAGNLEGRFTVKIGTQPGSTVAAGATWARTNGAWVATGGSSQAGQSRVICVTSNTTTPQTANGTNYRLDGATDLPGGSRVISAIIANATAAEAREISFKLDGEPYTQPDATTADGAGKVVYNTPNGQGLTNVFIYVAHQ